MMNRALLFLILTITQGCGVQTYVKQQSATQEARSSKVLELEQRLSRFLGPLARTKDFSGVVQIHFADGERAAAQFGYANWSTEELHSSENLYSCGSITKLVTIAALHAMVKDGALALNDPVQTYVPELVKPTITIAQVVEHTAGLPRDVPSHVGLSNRTSELIGWLNQNFSTPGERRYSNIGYELLAEVIARVTATAYAQVAQDLVLLPAGMADSRISSRPAYQAPNGAIGYTPGPLPLELTQSTSEPEPIGASGLQATITDLVALGRAMSEGSLQPLQSHPVLSSVFNESTFASQRAIWVQGTTRGYSAGVAVFPESSTVIAYATNVETYLSFGLEQLLAELVFGDEPKPLPERPPAVALTPEHRQLQGSYLHPRFGPIDIVAKSDRMELVVTEPGWRFYLTPITNGFLHWRFFNTRIGFANSDRLEVSAEEQLLSQPVNGFSLNRR